MKAIEYKDLVNLKSGSKFRVNMVMHTKVENGPGIQDITTVSLINGRRTESVLTVYPGDYIEIVQRLK